METGYVISENDHKRIEDSLRKFERMAKYNVFRRPNYPVGIGTSESGIFLPDGRVAMPAGTYTLDRDTHRNKWLWLDSETVGGNIYLTLPANPVVDDPYFFFGPSLGSYYERIYPNSGQTIIMPSATVVYGQYILFGSTAPSYGNHTLHLVCTAANTWACFYATSSVIT
jgi:hypothetical protein